MHRRAELFLSDWALQHVGQGNALQLSDPETTEIVARLIDAGRDAGVPEAALRSTAVLKALVVGVRALANGQQVMVLPLCNRRIS